jgi:hypothetical protein
LSGLRVINGVTIGHGRVKHIVSFPTVVFSSKTVLYSLRYCHFSETKIFELLKNGSPD